MLLIHIYKIVITFYQLIINYYDSFLKVDHHCSKAKNSSLTFVVNYYVK